MNELPTRSSEDRELPNAPTTMPMDTAKIPLVRPTTLPIQRGGEATSSPRGASGSVSPKSALVFMSNTLLQLQALYLQELLKAVFT
jgi:hypothetical protein